MKNTLCFLIVLFSSGIALGQNNIWERKSDLPGNSGRHHPVTWGILDSGYVLTGSVNSSLVSNDFYRYDPSADEWKQFPDFPGLSRSFAIGAVYEDKGYIGFGLTNTSYLNDLWRYDPQTGEWEQLASCPCAGRRHPAFTISDEGKLYAGLGDGAVGNLGDWWEYDIETDTWTERSDLPGAVRHHPFHFSIDGQAYTGLGHGNFAIFDDWYRYDPSDSSWTTLNNFPAEARVAGTQFAYNGKGYVLSGDGADHSYMATGEFWEYDPATDQWKELPPHPGISRWAPGSFMIGDTLYFTGGENRQTGVYQKDVWAIDMTDSYLSSYENIVAEAKTLNISPNPASGTIRFSGETELVEVAVYDMQGRCIQKGALNEHHLDISDLTKGVYIVKAKDNKGNDHRARLVKE